MIKILLLALALTGCGQDDSKSEPESEREKVTEEWEEFYAEGGSVAPLHPDYDDCIPPDESTKFAKGASKDEVLEALGAPDTVDAFMDWTYWEYPGETCICQKDYGTCRLQFENGVFSDPGGVSADYYDITSF